jgi:hypothetical protein
MATIRRGVLQGITANRCHTSLTLIILHWLVGIGR